MTAAQSYAVITPVLNERENLGRLAAALKAQTVPPRLWLIVDTGSDDGSLDMIHALVEDVSWVRSTTLDPGRARGGPIVRAFNAGSAEVPDDVEVIVKLDADVSFDADYFGRLLASFAEDPRLGIASGTCLEEQGGVWLERRVTADHVWGACRAYRAACLHDVSPLEERMGWDGIDVLKANARGWRTGIVPGLAFRHHRGEGSRDGGRAAPWLARGRAAQYMGYRPSFLLFRACHHALDDPMALMMIVGWLKPVLRREPACDDPVARAYLRRQQRLRELPLRLTEARGEEWISRTRALLGRGSGRR
jgi:glycosyltransferase involved in cell wall biosynthesis